MIFIKIESEPFPFEIERIDQDGIYVSELRPYWIYSAGYLKPEVRFKVVRQKKDLADCAFLKGRRDRSVYPVTPAVPSL